MGVSIARHRSHVAKWQAKFPNYKKKWPKHLFRHEPIENAISILKTGELVSRTDATANGIMKIDIAPANIIESRDEAHNSVRLYFRPRTPTQFRIEGIRKPADYYMDRHGGLLVMLVFSSESVLTMEDTRFSCGNMQSPYSRVLDGDGGFDELDFSGIYHDEAYPSDDQKRKRCAEVLARSPLDIATTLSAIVVRTDADVATLKYLLAREGLNNLLPLVKRSQGVGVFFHRYTAVQFVDSAPGRINFKLKGTASEGDIQTKLTVIEDSTNTARNLVSENLRPYQDYYTLHQLPAGRYRLLFELEGCYAHESVIQLEPKPLN